MTFIQGIPFPVFIAAVLTLATITTSHAAEYRIGKDVEKNGMKIGAVYIQAVKMDMGQVAGGKVNEHASHNSHGDHAEPAAPAAQASHSDHHATSGDLHIEADIEAAASNDWGFPAGAWIPYLRIQYTISKIGGDFTKSGKLLPMIANDGPHYGDNLDLPGSGKYRLKYDIAPPDTSEFPRHFDKETGIGEWWQPFSLEWEFVFVGTGKKGGY